MPSSPAPVASPVGPVPFKTTLGQDELRHRTLKLAPRQRTMLLLVDGKRTVNEVVALAQQAGAPPELFGELVALSLIEVPDVPAGHTAVATDIVIDGVVMQGVVIEADVPPPTDRADAASLPPPPATMLAPSWPEVIASSPVPLDEAPVEEPAVIDSQAIDVAPTEPESMTAMAEAGVDRPAESVAAMLERMGTADEPVLAETPVPLDRQLEHIDMPLPHSRPDEFPEAAAETAPVPLGEVSIAPCGESRVMPPAAVPETAPIALGAETPAEPLSPAEEALLRRVREMLSETLRFNAPLFTARTLIRVRLAPTRRELIQLVWEIEEHLGRSRRSRKTDRNDAQMLEAARELLGMGNTRVSGESQPGWSTTEASADWTHSDAVRGRRSTDPGA